MANQKIAGMSMKGGRKDKFFFCLLEYFPEHERWALKSLLQLKDETGIDREDIVRNWIEKFEVKDLVVDFPLSQPACHPCSLDCPGIENCEVEEVKSINDLILELIQEDQRLEVENPKKYEQKRNSHDEIDYSRDIFHKESHEHILSRSFKRRLKKGYLPYWNRPIDLWVWNFYYDQLLDLFNSSYDSFGNTSLMILSRFSYLRRHFPSDLKLYESFGPLILIELLRSGIIKKKHIQNFNDIELGMETRIDLVQKIEKEANLFLYDHDFEVLVKNPHAFDSFMLALSGMQSLSGKIRDLPKWTLPKETNFLVPNFSSDEEKP